MKNSKHLVRDDLKDDYGLVLSTDLESHERFLQHFTTTGDTDGDLASFFRGVGRSEVLDMTSKAGGSLPDLAQKILSNHRQELARLDRGELPHWGGYKRWAPGQLRLYRHLLDQESSILTAILAKRRPS